MEGLLSVVGTPIGNLEDASPRVRRVLGEADVVLCEDTRVTGRLMSAFGLHVRLERCDENVMAEKIEQVLGRLAAGERVAFVSDAGMPGVSDPGQRLVDAALDAGVRVEVVPGPSAVTCALVASGLASEHFFFEGFLPRKRGAQLARLAELAAVPGTLVVYESPRRVAETLANVAEVTSAMGPNTINRENVKRKIVISANASGRDMRSVVNDIQKRVAEKVKMPEGYHVEYGGQFESEQSASRTLTLASVLSIIVIFLLLYMQFKNALESAVILINLPLALIGGVFTLVCTTGEVSIPAIIGFISLFGIATRNGMLLINRYNMLRGEKETPLRECIVHGSLDRLNPILMTALCSALALIPLALRGSLPGNEIQSPMAKVILGGLLTSTFLNGFIIPIVYEWMNKKKIVK